MLFNSLILFTVFFISNSVKAESSMVLLWNSLSPLKPALEKICSEDFKDSILTEMHDSMLIAFIDDQDVEPKDLANCRTDSGEKCFDNLAQMKNKVFYAQVENPIEVLKNSNIKKEHVQIDENGDLQKPIEFETNKAVLVTFPEDLSENLDKAEALHKKDYIINKIYEKLSSLGKVIGMYTKENGSNKSTRVIRQAEQKQQPQKKDEKTGVAFNVNNKFLIYLKELLYKELDSTAEPKIIQIHSVSMSDDSKTGFNIDISGSDNHNVKFHINKSAGYWYAQNFEFDNKKLMFDTPINAADNFSFYCGNLNMTDQGKKFTLSWFELQMEPNFNQTNGGQSIKFHDPWHCVGFTSTGILSGLFVSFMLLAILTVGITWLLDIRTMDRFDDPKGKTITVNASD